MSRRKKPSDEDCEKIAKLIEKGHQIKDLATKYGIDRSTIYNRCKYLYKSQKIPIEIKNRSFIKISSKNSHSRIPIYMMIFGFSFDAMEKIR